MLITSDKSYNYASKKTDYTLHLKFTVLQMLPLLYAILNKTEFQVKFSEVAFHHKNSKNVRTRCLSGSVKLCRSVLGVEPALEFLSLSLSKKKKQTKKRDRKNKNEVAGHYHFQKYEHNLCTLLLNSKHCNVLVVTL